MFKLVTSLKPNKKSMSAPKPFNTIATAVAFSPNMEANVSESVRIKEMLGKQLILIHIGEKKEEEAAGLEQVLRETGCNMQEVRVIWENGDPVNAILRVAEEHQVDLLIAGALPREGLLKYYMGSIARRLVRKSNCSVLLMTRPSKLKATCGIVVVNGLDHPKTPYTVKIGAQVAKNLGSTEMVVIEELDPAKAGKNYDSDKQLEKVNRQRQELQERAINRIREMIHNLPEDIRPPSIKEKVIFGKKGYTIGHYTQTASADLLVMNSPDTKLGFLDRVFTHDLEYILSELPSDLLIVHSTEKTTF